MRSTVRAAYSRAMAAPTLYLRDDCHLCDLALDALAAAGLPDLDCVFIDGDAALETRYGTRVPVLRSADGCELDWPFEPAELARLSR